MLRASGLSAGTYSFFNAAILALQVVHLTRHLELSPAKLGWSWPPPGWAPSRCPLPRSW